MCTGRTFARVDPAALAAELDITPQALRRWLRSTTVRSEAEAGRAWVLSEEQVTAARHHFGAAGPEPSEPVPTKSSQARTKRDDSDEASVLDLCDEILGDAGRRQHRFEWLLGDPGSSGRAVRLPVDSYYPDLKIVVEYRERQHDEPVSHFDKPDKLTISGVHRGEQRRLYDERRETLIPQHGLRLVIVKPSDLASTAAGRLKRDRLRDIAALRQLLDADGGEGGSG